MTRPSQTRIRAQAIQDGIRKRQVKHLFADGPMTGSSSWTRSPSSTSPSRSSGDTMTKGLPVPSARRWVVERSFGWMTRWRRLVRDYEQRIDVSDPRRHAYQPPNE
jgi:transposase